MYDPSVEEILTDDHLLVRKVGKPTAKKIRQRIAELKAMPTFLDYVSVAPGRPHLLKGDLHGCCAVSLASNTRLIVRPHCEGLDQESLKMCEVALVKGVCDYHGEKNEWIIP